MSLYKGEEVIKYIPYDQYLLLFNKLKNNIRVCPSDLGLDPSFFSDEERKIIITKAFNPEIPMSIQVVTEEGIIEYKPEINYVLVK